MKLKILLPHQVLVDTTVEKLTVETPAGSQGFLPHHLDYVTSLVPGVLSYSPEQGEEQFLAVDEGILVKCGEMVQVAVTQASGQTTLQHLDQLQELIEENFQQLDEENRKARSAFAHLEMQILHHLLRD